MTRIARDQLDCVYFFDHETQQFILVAKNFQEFLLNISEYNFCDMESVIWGGDYEEEPFSFDDIPKDVLGSILSN